MKKLAISMAVAAAMGVTAADAATQSEYAPGVLVPNVIFQGNETTAVAITSRVKGTVFWTFFDENSNHVTDGQFDVTANDLYPFVWSEKAGVGLDGKRGYLVFDADVASGNPPNCDNTKTDGLITECDAVLNPIAGAAVQVMPDTQDVAFVPALPLASVDLSTFPITPTALGPSDVDYLVAGANCVASGNSITGTIGTLTESITGPYNDDIDMRYFIDGSSGGTDTNIAVWSAQDVSGTWTVNMFNDEQSRKSVNFELANKELNFIDVESIVGRPADFKDGFIRWDVPCGLDVNGNPAPWNGVVTYSIINAPDFGAVQSIVSPWGPNVTP